MINFYYPNSFSFQKKSFFLLLIFIFSANLNTAFAQYTDTVYVSIPEGQFGSYCSDLTDFESLTSVSNTCTDMSGEFVSFYVQDQSTGCVDYFGEAGGSEFACITLCDANHCDSILLWVEVIEPLIPCTAFFNQGEYHIGTTNCDDPTAICLSIPLETIGNFEITHNSEDYENGFGPCLVDTVYAYSFSTLIGQGEQGPYTLDEWSINGTIYSGTFQDLNDLLLQINIWDPNGEWGFDPNASHIIVGGVSGNNYGDMIASDPSSPNSTATLSTNIGINPQGSRIFFEVGLHDVIVRDLTSGCTDTAKVNIYCIEPIYISDTLFNNTAGEICLDVSDLPGFITSVENTCPELGTGNAGISISSTDNCISFNALNVGVDELCVVICDDLGLCQTTYIDFTIVSPENGVIEEELIVGSSQTYCPGISELSGEATSIVNACEEGDEIDFEIDESTFCVTYTALAIGTDTACIVICDDLGVCDTTTFIITGILEQYPIPEAHNDYDTTSTSTAITIDVTKNDLISNVDEISIVNPPMDGQLEIIPNGSIVYLPDEFFCGHDYFTYEICNPSGDCSQATVEVLVLCPAITIFNGISPDGDGQNDFFYIEGIEKYPTSHLYIYNRWGHLIYETIGYENDWAGTWDGKLLPSNTYMYVLELNDFGHEVLTGYMYIMRE